MRFLFLILLVYGCCDYTGWKKVENPFYEDTSTDSIWIYVESGDYWTGVWAGKKYQFHLLNDTLFIKQQE